MIRLLPRIAALATLCLAPLGAHAQDWALEGIDPVAYARSGEAVPGRSDLVTMWHGLAWHFANEENRAAFESNPREFAPGLSGLCVVALSEGRAEPGNPRHFVVIGERTYLVRTEQARQRLANEPKKILMSAKATWARMNP